MLHALLLRLAALTCLAGAASACGTVPDSPQPERTVWSWGDNRNGQLGTGAVSDRSGPALVVGLPDAADVRAGAYFSVARTTSGSVLQWGRDWGSDAGARDDDYYHRRCIDLTEDCHPTPVPVTTADGSPITDASAIGVGARQGLLIRTPEHTAWSWGSNESGQLGYDKLRPDGTEQPRRSRFARAARDGPDQLVTLGGGAGFSLALQSGPPAITVWAWGTNGSGELGVVLPGDEFDTPIKRMQPGPVPGLGGDVIAVAGGTAHVVTLQANGVVRAWGGNAYGQTTSLLVPTPSPDQPVRPVEFVQGAGYQPLQPVASIAAGCSHTLALTPDKRILSWGDTRYGQRGDVTWDTARHGNQTSDVHELKPFGTGAPVEDVAAGCNFSLALLADGTVWAWGDNTYGQLGVDTTQTCTFPGPHGNTTIHAPCSITPVQVPGLVGVESVAAGATHSLAVVRG